MSIVSCGCGFRAQDWTLSCDITDFNGTRCGTDPDGNQVVWSAPDDGVLHFEDEPTIKSQYRNSLGAAYDPVEQGVGGFNITAADCVLPWTNDTCRDYWVLTEYTMGTPGFELGNSTEVYIGSHNLLTLTDPDGVEDELVDTNPSVGEAYGSASIGGITTISHFYPPVNWPVWTKVRPGYSIEASIQGTGLVNADGAVDAPEGVMSVQCRYGWSLRMTCWPQGID